MTLAEAPRIVSPVSQGMTEQALLDTLRPTSLREFIGQDEGKPIMSEAMQAARILGIPLDHVLLSGPAGLGKTTMAKIIATEMNGRFVDTHGGVLDSIADLRPILCNLTDGDILFIDEIHRLKSAVQDYLLTAMEDFQIAFVFGKGTDAARAIPVKLARFTLVGATTRKSALNQAMRERFGLDFNFDYYDLDSLTHIVRRSALLLNLRMSEASARNLAQRSRGTPRIVNRLLRRLRDFKVVRGIEVIEPEHVDQSLRLQQIDQHGLDPLDRRYLRVLAAATRPMGLQAIASTMQQEAGTLLDTVEPYLLYTGLIERQPGGRRITKKGMAYAS